MHANNKNRFLDGVLDKALEDFGNGEPRTGLENRVLANLRTEQERTANKSGWCWAVGSAVAATAVIGALWLGNHPGIPKELVKMSRDSKKPEGLGALKVEQVARPQVPAPTSDAKMGRERRRLTSRTGTATLPRLRQFPSARPLSGQEKLLLTYMTTAPDSEVIATVARAENASDLRINDLQISPLSGPETHEANYTK